MMIDGMKNTSSVIRFCTAALCCALVLSYGSYKSLFKTQSGINVAAQQQTIEYSSNTSSDERPAETESAPESKDTSSTASAESESTNVSVAASADKTVQGAVIDKFISPYTANTSYNNIYLKNNTDLDINLKELVKSKLGYKIEKGGEPQVLIVHTHATESYLKENRDYYTSDDLTRTTDNDYNMVALGKIVADKLNSAGINTIHSTTAHDYPSYNESYKRAAETICNYVKKYPSIKVVIDLHRDAIAANDTDKVKVTTEIDGKKAAQIMLVMGSQSGNVTNFPNWKENLKLAVRIQQTVEVMYPTLARSIHFMSKNYNESLTTGSVLIEIGTDGNTIDEAKYSAELLANALISLFNTL